MLYDRTHPPLHSTPGPPLSPSSGQVRMRRGRPRAFEGRKEGEWSRRGGQGRVRMPQQLINAVTTTTTAITSTNSNAMRDGRPGRREMIDQLV